MYNVKLDTFEGPFDLLFHLIEKNEVDIKDIPIATILDQYMEYLNKMQKIDLDITTDFILMAATLMKIKSEMLLPKICKDEMNNMQVQEVDPREELVTKLMEYKKYKVIAEKLKSMCLFNKRFFKENPEIKYIDRSLSLKYCKNDIVKTYQKITSKLEHNIEAIKYTKEPYTVEDKIKIFIKKLIRRPILLFSEFIRKSREKSEVIVSFIALLELIRLNKITAEQNQVFGDILIKKLQE
ncbi:MAG: segregation/condensation protein A [Thermoanaerobacteraceae bacterium]|nr:segregation/condensation protein A [Thermoanaerobacteraceae bacterium]